MARSRARLSDLLEDPYPPFATHRILVAGDRRFRSAARSRDRRFRFLLGIPHFIVLDFWCSRGGSRRS